MADQQELFPNPKPKQHMQNFVYLGDGVYANCDGYHIWLKVESFADDVPDNLIALEPAVFQSLLINIKKLEEETGHKNFFFGDFTI